MKYTLRADKRLNVALRAALISHVRNNDVHWYSPQELLLKPDCDMFDDRERW